MCFEQLQLLFPDYSALLDAHIFIVVFDLLQIQIEKKFYLYIEKSASGRASLFIHWHKRTDWRDVSASLTARKFESIYFTKIRFYSSTTKLIFPFSFFYYETISVVLFICLTKIQSILLHWAKKSPKKLITYQKIIVEIILPCTRGFSSVNK